MAGYRALTDVYEWLIPDHKLTPDGAVGAVGELVKSLPPGARVLDCACGTGQLAVGLAALGFDVVASDASPGMVRRTQELADQAGVSLNTFEAMWDELPDHLDASTFDIVFCVGNSLGHAEGASGRSSALASMARLLNPGGRLVLTSRTWERIRDGGSRIDVWDKLVRRNGHDAVVMYQWEIAATWEQEHHLQIVVAQVEPDGTVISGSERLSIWPFQYDELVKQLQAVGLTADDVTFDPDGGGYKVVAVRE